jgi:tRNA(Ile)-lysidine synthetase-like protein
MSNADVYSAVQTFGKTNKHSKLCVSLSGGVDSMALLHSLQEYQTKTKGFKSVFQIKEITAVHINYNNRITCDEEVRFVQWYCEILNIPLEVRHITEMHRNRDSSRAHYETLTRDIRFEMYKKQNCPILLGHNHEDCIENILSNIASKRKFENLKGMAKVSIEKDVSIRRPFLDISKTEIIKYSNDKCIPRLPDSTPVWSRRGKLRDHVIPVLQKYEPQLLKGLNFMSGYLTEMHNKNNI